MKKITLLLLMFCVFIQGQSQLNPSEESVLKGSIDLITGFPTEWGPNNGQSDEFVDFLINQTLDKVNYKKNPCYSTGDANGQNLCCCDAVVDDYIELDFSSNQISLVPSTNNPTEVESHDMTFQFYKAMINKLFAENVAFVKITRFEIVKGLNQRPNPEPLNISSIKIWYKKCTHYTCTFYGQ